MIDSIISYINPGFSANLSGLTLFIILAIMGLFVGFLAGLFGVGGGFLLVPLMNIVLGIPMEMAAGSATCYIIGTSSTGFIKQVRNKNVEFRVFIFIALGSALGAVFGDMLQNILIFYVAKGDKEVFEKIMLIVFFILLIIIAAIMFFAPERDVTKKTLLQRIKLGIKIDLHKSNIHGVSVVGLILIGLTGGILTGLLGISGGVLFVPILVLGVGLGAHMATGTSLGVVLAASISAVIKKGISGSGKVNVSIALSLLVASAIGVQTGIYLSGKVHSTKLKKYFSIIVLFAAVMVVYKILSFN